MNDYTPNTLSVKTCSSGEKCVHPDGPVLNISEFYSRANGSLLSKCRECAKLYSRQFVRKRYGERATRRSPETEAIEVLRSAGIYASTGIASEWTWVDVVAWGCVRIEVKTSNFKNGRFNFSLCPRIHANWDKNDLLMLACNWWAETTYHIFPMNYDLFYRADGSLIDHLCYIPDPKFRRKTLAITTEIMDQHQNNWGLIEKQRQFWINNH